MNSSLPTLFATADTPAITVVIVGFLFVLGVLGIMTVATNGLGLLFRGKVPVVPAFPVAEKVAKAEAAEADQIDPAIIAVISAAIHHVADGRVHRVLSIQSRPGGWAQEGRRAIFSSHRLR